MNITIRPATSDDAGEIISIYAPYIRDTCITFETEVPTIMEFAARMENIINSYPYLICEANGCTAGYAYASKFHARAAYRYSAEASVYVSPEFHGKGIGKALYTRLLELLKEQGIYTVYAGVTLPNEKSVSLHKALGFTEVGIYHNAGYKLGKWLDVMWLEKPLRDYDDPCTA